MILGSKLYLKLLWCDEKCSFDGNSKTSVLIISKSTVLRSIESNKLESMIKISLIRPDFDLCYKYLFILRDYRILISAWTRADNSEKRCEKTYLKFCVKGKSFPKRFKLKFVQKSLFEVFRGGRSMSTSVSWIYIISLYVTNLLIWIWKINFICKIKVNKIRLFPTNTIFFELQKLVIHP